MAYTDAQRRRDYGYANGSPDPDLVDITDRLPWRPRTISGKRQTVWAHRLLADLFIAAAHDAVGRSGWIPKRTDSYAERPIRGSSSWSLHSWAIAWDIFRTFADQPPPGGVWTPTDRMPASFVAAYTERGFTWGGNWNRRDTPHIEWSGPPPTQGNDDMTPEQDARQKRIETMLESLMPLMTGIPAVGVGSVLEAANQANYSLAGIGSNNIRDYINAHDGGARRHTTQEINEQTDRFLELASQPADRLHQADIELIIDGVAERLTSP